MKSTVCAVKRGAKQVDWVIYLEWFLVFTVVWDLAIVVSHYMKKMAITIYVTVIANVFTAWILLYLMNQVSQLLN